MVTTSAAPPIARAATPSGSTARPSWRSIVAVVALLAGALGLRLVLWDRAVGFEQGDPLEYVNIAYKLAFGIGIEWWDLRPLLLSLIYVPVLYVAQWWPDPTGEAMVRALRLVNVLFGVGVVGLTYLLGRRLSGEVVGLGAGLLVAVNPVVNRMSVSTHAEVPSTFFILLSLWLLVRALDAEGGALRWLAFGAGLAIGLGCMIRYQAIFYLPPVGLWVAVVALARAPGGPVDRVRAIFDLRAWPGALMLGFGGGLLLAILVQGAIELAAYGRPFHSLLASFEYNVTSGLAPVEFGEEPFDWYVRQAPSWLGPMTAILAAIGLSALVRGRTVAGWRLVALAGLTMLLALSALPHKEERFMSQVFPLLALLAAQGAASLAGVGGLGLGAQRAVLEADGEAARRGASGRSSRRCWRSSAARPRCWSPRAGSTSNRTWVTSLGVQAGGRAAAGRHARHDPVAGRAAVRRHPVDAGADGPATSGAAATRLPGRSSRAIFCSSQSTGCWRIARSTSSWTLGSGRSTRTRMASCCTRAAAWRSRTVGARAPDRRQLA